MIANLISITKLGGGAVVPKYLPVADFTSDTQTVIEGNSVSYTDLSTVDPLGPPITQWNWTFEGGTPSTSNLQNPTVTYNTNGNYDVTLEAINADGSNTKYVNDYITVEEAPVVMTIQDWQPQLDIYNVLNDYTSTQINIAF